MNIKEHGCKENNIEDKSMQKIENLKSTTYEDSKEYSNNCISLQEPIIVDDKFQHQQQLLDKSQDIDDQTSMFKKLVKYFEAGSVAGSILTLYIGVVGAGVLSIPLSFYQSGYIISILTYTIGAFCTYYSCMFLVYSAQKTQSDSYMQLVQKLCNKPIMYFIKTNLVINNWAYSIAFGVIINHLMSRVIQYILLNHNNHNLPEFMTNPNGFFYVSIIVLLIAMPLTLKKQLTGLSFFCLLGFLISMFNMMIILVYAFSDEYNDGQNMKFMESCKLDGIVLTLPTAIFSFICQTNILDIKKELKKQPQDDDHAIETKQLKTIFGTTFILATVVYSVIGFLGYFTFSANAEQLLNGKDKAALFILGYNNNSSLLMLVELLTVGNMGLTLVFCYKPAKDSYFDLFWPGQDPNSFSFVHRFIVVFIMALLTIIVTIISQSLQQIIVIVVAVQGPLICFILPAYFYQKTFYKELKMVEHLMIGLLFYVFMVLLSILSLIKLYTN